MFSETERGVVEDYEFEWNKLQYVHPEREAELLDVFGGFLTPQSFRNKVVLDAGCGQGQMTFFVASYGPKLLYGVDFSDAIHIAENNLKVFKNVKLVKANLHNPPPLPRFDIVYSIGVVHHMPDMEEGFRSLVKLLKPQGELFVWIYGYSQIVPVIKKIKRFSTKLPRETLWKLSLIPTFLIAGMNFLSEFIGGPFSHNSLLTIYNHRSFNNYRTAAFDKMNAKIAHYLTEGELRSMLHRSGLSSYTIERRHPGWGSSWRVYGRK